MDARDIKEIDSEQLELIRQMEQYLSCPCQLIRPADEDGDIMETYWEARRRGQQQGFVPVLVRCDDLLLEGMLEQSESRTATERNSPPGQWMNTVEPAEPAGNRIDHRCDPHRRTGAADSR